jgi:plasmid maintenance system killer protein
LKILFQDPNFRDECNDFKLLKRRKGELRAKKIRLRLDDMADARNLSAMKLLPGRCHELTGNHHGHLSLDLDHPWRLIIEPADIPPAVKADGGLDWDNIQIIRVLGIEDTHD